MRESEAIRAIETLAAAYRTELTDAGKEQWAKSLVAHDHADLLEAINICVGGGRFMPSLADLLGLVRECRNDRLRQDRPLDRSPGNGVLFAEFLRDNPAYRERVDKLLKMRRPPELGMSPGQAGIAALLKGGMSRE